MNESRPDDDFDALMRHALTRSPGGEPPPGFARAMALRVADLPDTGVIEKYAIRVLLTLAVLAAGACAFVYSDPVASRIGQVVSRAPWSLLLTAGMVMGAIKLAELARRIPFELSRK